MATLEILFEGGSIAIPYTQKEKLSSIFLKFCSKIDESVNNCIFLSEGTLLNGELDESFLKATDSGKKLIVAYRKEIDPENEDDEGGIIVRPKEIICPRCKESSCFDFKNYKFSFFQCKNEHKIENISINDFDRCQGINLTKITCSKCKERNKGAIDKYLFFTCLTCKDNLCPVCK